MFETISSLFSDSRYVILLADGLAIIALAVILTFRLVNKVAQPEPATEAPSQSVKEPPTIDQLNIDIPL